MDEHIYPNECEHTAWVRDSGRSWTPWPLMETLKSKAREQELWNLFLPTDYGAISPGLTNVEYAPLAEIMGRVPWAPEVFNCSAPDTGNMEVLAKYGDDTQRAEWLEPLLAGDMRSSYLMTEPGVASSDATNIATEIKADGHDWVINGHKWWITGILHPRCHLLIVLGRSNSDGPRHKQHSMVIVPRDAAGVEIVRPLRVFGDLHSPGGHAEVRLNNVRVPRANMVLGQGRGFEIAQGRLGPGRIHHCMRSIGQAQRALEHMCHRAAARVAFGRRLADQGSVRQDVARSFCEIEQARLLTLMAAWKMDHEGAKAAMDLIAAIKIVAPNMAQIVADRAVQIHGAMGISDDTPLAEAFIMNRYLRLADGPDEVHMSQLGRLVIDRLSGQKK